MANWITLKQLSEKRGIAESDLRTWANLGYITSANVASPEVSTAGSGYALPRTLLFGVNVTF